MLRECERLVQAAPSKQVSGAARSLADRRASRTPCARLRLTCPPTPLKLSLTHPIQPQFRPPETQLSLQPSPRADYMLLVYALLAGDARALDSVTRRSPGLAPTIEDFMWLKLSVMRASGATGGRRV